MATTTTTARRLDVLTAQVVTAIHTDADAAAASADPSACLSLVRATLERRGGIGRTYKREAAVQHLFSTVWHYTRYFSPGPDWDLIDDDAQPGQLRWRHVDASTGAADIECGDVVDVVAATAHHDVASLPRPHRVSVRLCNVANRDESLLWLPGRAHPQPWTVAADPVDRAHRERSLMVVAA